MKIQTNNFYLLFLRISLSTCGQVTRDIFRSNYQLSFASDERRPSIAMFAANHALTFVPAICIIVTHIHRRRHDDDIPR